jgi:TrmH family RNA methyltransferase
MISRNDIKYIQSLCHKKLRQQENLFIAEGPKVVDELLQSEYWIKNIYATSDWIAHNTDKKVAAVEITEIELGRISALQTPHQVLAVVERKQPDTASFNNQWTLLLDGIQDPGNLGTIIRIADWFGIKNIFCSEDTAELYNPKVIQSTMGSFVRVNLRYESLSAVLEKAGVPVYGAVLNGENVYVSGKQKEGILIIGNEGKGMRKELLPFVTHPVTIPRIGGAESLNAGVAAGIIISHLLA